MERQPNFNRFLDPMNAKTNRIQNKLNRSNQKDQVRQKRQQYGQIPETDSPSTRNALKIYKRKQRRNQQQFSTQIGVQIRQFTTIEQDYISYFAQILMTECPYLKIFIIQPNYLYFQMTAITTQDDLIDQQQKKQENQLENRILIFLNAIKEQVFDIFMRSQLSSQIILSVNFQGHQLIQRFQEQVVKKIKQMHKQMLKSKNINK